MIKLILISLLKMNLSHGFFLPEERLNDGSEYLGPYTSVKKVRELLDFIKQTIQLRTCSLNLTEKNIRKGKFKVCLEYHLGNCKGLVKDCKLRKIIMKILHQLKNLLKGNLSPVIRHFKEEMKEFADNLAFEKAEIIKKEN